jgi:hypothetical protein
MRRILVAVLLALLGAGSALAQEGAAAPATTSGGAATGAAATGGAVTTTAGAFGFIGLAAAGLFVAADSGDGGTTHAAPTHH